MLKPGSLFLVLDHEELHRQTSPNKPLCGLKIGADPVGDELSPQVPSLISHQMILVHTLPQSTSGGLRATSTHGLIWRRGIEDSVDAMSLGQSAAAAVVESDGR